MDTIKSRAFGLVLVLGCVPALVLVWMCSRTLGRSGDAAADVARFEALQAPLTWLVPLVFLVLVFVQARSYLARRASGWGFLIGWGYLALFTALDYVWLSSRLFQYTKDTDTWQGGFSVAPLLGGLWIVLGGGFVGSLWLGLGARRSA